MASSSWDDMKRVREDEYFHKQEKEKTSGLKNALDAVNERHAIAQEKLAGFKKGNSPITGAPFFKARVQGHNILDCPEDEMMIISYASFLNVMETLQKDDKQAINAWKAFLEAQTDTDEAKNK
ncbi:MAG: hypothetical protein ACI9TY_001681 [Alphaproteobacteria bacterium]|jgi:hypothetical protein